MDKIKEIFAAIAEDFVAFFSDTLGEEEVGSILGKIIEIVQKALAAL